MPPKRKQPRKQAKRSRRPTATRLPPPVDQSELVERIVPRRRLALRTGDVLIEQSKVRGFARDATVTVYQICVEGQGTLPGRYATFDSAALDGEHLASTNRVSLYYRDAPSAPLYLLRDFR